MSWYLILSFCLGFCLCLCFCLCFCPCFCLCLGLILAFVLVLVLMQWFQQQIWHYLVLKSYFKSGCGGKIVWYHRITYIKMKLLTTCFWCYCQKSSNPRNSKSSTKKHNRRMDGKLRNLKMVVVLIIILYFGSLSFRHFLPIISSMSL